MAQLANGTADNNVVSKNVTYGGDDNSDAETIHATNFSDTNVN